jgi:hypothetical protein
LDPQTVPWNQIVRSYVLPDVLRDWERKQPKHPLVAVFKPLLAESEEVLRRERRELLIMSETYKHSASADGWWQCGDGPREPLTEIQLFFYETDFSGSGIDLRQVFILYGTWLEAGRVAIRKENHGPFPDDNLIGDYDGEGTMWGTWTSAEGSGNWLMRLRGECKSKDAEAVRQAWARSDQAWALHRKAQQIAATILPSEDDVEKTDDKAREND